MRTKTSTVEGNVTKDCFCAVCMIYSICRYTCSLSKVQVLSCEADLAEIIKGTVLSSEADLHESGVFR
jgi:hypothetical protein